MVASPRALSLAGWSAGLITTALVAWSPYLLFAYHSPSLHLVLDSVDACVALLLTYLLYGRFVRTHALRDLLLAEGLLLLALAGLGLTVLVGRLDSPLPGSYGVWSALSLRVTGAVLIGVASLMGSRPVAAGWRLRLVVLPSALLVVGLTVLWVVRDSLAIAVSETPPASALRPVITGHPLLLVGQGFTALCFFVASIGFTIRAVQRRDELLRWLGPACALSGFARVNYCLFPSLYGGWVYTGDLLRTAAYLVLLVGAAREVGQYWSASARVAVLEDRRRLARELHDGVLQELGYIRAEASTMPGVDVPRRHIVDACDRALDEARAAVEALGRGPEEPLSSLLHRAARDVAERQGGHVVIDLDDAVDAEQLQRHALARITREAVSNAIRHGSAKRIEVTLERDPSGRRLVVRDDGRGFDVRTATRGTGYGMTSMRERALGLPGSLEIDSCPGRGTTVVVMW
ncbi:MAG TPA: sensor histidine kinase [Nocardioides sp.]|uniref:sensor histidine kinase n=1 Tax=Nocardioides sp. TaxID=35761 RepID=UPI002F3E7BB1